jgi:hypothetical protein
MADQAFWVDEQFDREHARRGGSRYDETLRSRVGEFDDAWGDIAPVTFAATAWLLATTLSPGYVRWHRRVVSAVCSRSPWDGSLIASVTLVSAWPAELTWTRQWGRDRGWRDWPQVFGQYVHPSPQDHTRGPYLRSMLLAEAPVPIDGLPAAPEGPDDPNRELVSSARRAVTVLVRELNEILTPMIQQLEAGVPADRG